MGNRFSRSGLIAPSQVESMIASCVRTEYASAAGVSSRTAAIVAAWVVFRSWRTGHLRFIIRFPRRWRVRRIPAGSTSARASSQLLLLIGLVGLRLRLGRTAFRFGLLCRSRFRLLWRGPLRLLRLRPIWRRWWGDPLARFRLPAVRRRWRRAGRMHYCWRRFILLARADRRRRRRARRMHHVGLRRTRRTGRVRRRRIGPDDGFRQTARLPFRSVRRPIGRPFIGSRRRRARRPGSVWLRRILLARVGVGDSGARPGDRR